MELKCLPEEIANQLESYRQVDILVGIPSYNNAQTIGHVAHVVAKGIKENFPELRAIILNSDGGSRDGTADAFMNSDTFGIPKLSFRYAGIPGKGSAIRAIFEAAKLTGAKYCAMLDSDLRSIEPFWLERLLKPMIEGESDYVTPYYLRHKYDGTITNNIAYPMTAALYGLDIRQPIGGDFGFNSKLVNTWLERDDWDENVYRFGIDIWMTTTAINSGAKIVQAFLGAKVHDEKDPGQSLGPMFYQVVGTLFRLMNTYKSSWSEITTVKPVNIFGDRFHQDVKPIQINEQRLKDKFREGFEAHIKVYEEVLSPELLRSLKRELETLQGIEVNLWADILLSYGQVFQTYPDTDLLMKSLVPLYFGRVAHMLTELKDLDSLEAEERISSWKDIILSKKLQLLR